jgi:hypothetical protein
MDKRLRTRVLNPSIIMHMWPTLVGHPTKTKLPTRFRDHFNIHWQLDSPFDERVTNTTHGRFSLAAKLWSIP